MNLNFLYHNEADPEAGSPPAADPAPVADTPAEQGSLLGEAAPELAAGEFFLSEGIKGVGDQPEWFMSEKYGNISEQAKGYSELQKKFGSFTGSPKDGFTAPDGIEKDDALLAELTTFASESNMSQEGFDKAWELLVAQNGAAESTSVEAEMLKLGNSAQANTRIKNVENYLRNATGEGYEAIMPMVSDANSVMLVEALMKATAPVKLPIDGGDSPSGLTWQDIESEMYRKNENGQLLRTVDRTHEVKIQNMMKEFGGNKPNVATIG